MQTWRDVIEELPLEVKAGILAAERGAPRADQLTMDEVALSDDERKVLALLKADESIHIDQLIADSGFATGQLMVALLQLEMADRIKQLPGKCFVKKI